MLFVAQRAAAHSLQTMRNVSCVVKGRGGANWEEHKSPRPLGCSSFPPSFSDPSLWSRHAGSAAGECRVEHHVGRHTSAIRRVGKGGPEGAGRSATAATGHMALVHTASAPTSLLWRRR